MTLYTDLLLYASDSLSIVEQTRGTPNPAYGCELKWFKLLVGGEPMVGKIAILLGMCGILIAPPTLATTSSPSPAPSELKFAICAPISTGIPEKIAAEQCPKQMRPLGLGPIVHAKTRPKFLNPNLKNRFLSAQTAAHALGFEVSVRSGWRSWNTQAQLYQKALREYKNARIARRWVLPPERSMHVWGVALDVHFGSPKAKTWFRWHSNKFGLCRTYQNEWWHYEPVISPGEKCPAMKPFAK